jgi:hypothetical protein
VSLRVSSTRTAVSDHRSRSRLALAFKRHGPLGRANPNFSPTDDSSDLALPCARKRDCEAPSEMVSA